MPRPCLLEESGLLDIAVLANPALRAWESVEQRRWLPGPCRLFNMVWKRKSTRCFPSPENSTCQQLSSKMEKPTCSSCSLWRYEVLWGHLCVSHSGPDKSPSSSSRWGENFPSGDYYFQSSDLFAISCRVPSPKPFFVLRYNLCTVKCVHIKCCIWWTWQLLCPCNQQPKQENLLMFLSSQLPLLPGGNHFLTSVPID